jgi:hypothetical protein
MIWFGSYRTFILRSISCSFVPEGTSRVFWKACHCSSVSQLWESILSMICKTITKIFLSNSPSHRVSFPTIYILWMQFRVSWKDDARFEMDFRSWKILVAKTPVLTPKALLFGWLVFYHRLLSCLTLLWQNPRSLITNFWSDQITLVSRKL